MKNDGSLDEVVLEEVEKKNEWFQDIECGGKDVEVVKDDGMQISVID